MAGERYEGLPDLVKQLKEICSGLTEGIGEFNQGVKASKEEINRRPLMIRSFAQKDFESNTGMGLDEWAEFSERLSDRFKSIAAVVQQIEDNLIGSRFGEVKESLERLEEASTPFLQRFDLVTQAFNRFANYMLEMPKRMESMPGLLKRFMSTEDSKMAGEAPKLGERIKRMNEALAEAKKLITDVIERYKIIGT